MTPSQEAFDRWWLSNTFRSMTVKEIAQAAADWGRGIERQAQQKTSATGKSNQRAHERVKS